jgi:hypothetical protein
MGPKFKPLSLFLPPDTLFFTFISLLGQEKNPGM